MHLEGICSNCWCHPIRKGHMQWVQTLEGWVPLICISQVSLLLCRLIYPNFFCWALLSCPFFLLGVSIVPQTLFSSHHTLFLFLVFLLFQDLSNYYLQPINIRIYIFILKPFLKPALYIDVPNTLHKHLI